MQTLLEALGGMYGDEILFSAPLEKMRHVRTGTNSFKTQELPMTVSDLETIAGVEQRDGWTVTGHVY